MTLDGFLAQNAGTIIAALISAIPGTIGAVYGVMIHWRQTKTQRDIGEIKYEIRNGLGDAVAGKTLYGMKPALTQQTRDIARNAEVVAAALVEAGDRRDK